MSPNIIVPSASQDYSQTILINCVYPNVSPLPTLILLSKSKKLIIKSEKNIKNKKIIYIYIYSKIKSKKNQLKIRLKSTIS
jgi:hypothetical protein